MSRAFALGVNSRKPGARKGVLRARPFGAYPCQFRGHTLTYARIGRMFCLRLQSRVVRGLQLPGLHPEVNGA